MDRVTATGYVTIGGKRYWQNANEGAGIQGTDFDEVFFNDLQECVVGVEEGFGLTPANSSVDGTPAPDTQLLQAIARAAASNVTTVAGATTLTADNAGIMEVSGAAGSFTITLPASASANGKPLRFRFVRTDATTNTVSIAFASGDTTLPGGGAGPLTLPSLGQLDVIGDGAGHWVCLVLTPIMAAYMIVSGAQQVSANGGAFTSTAATSFIVPASGIVEAEVWGGGGGGACTGLTYNCGVPGAAGGYARKLITGLTPGATITITVGVAGAEGTYSPFAQPSGGGTTSFGSYISATGGAGGQSTNGALPIGNAVGGSGVGGTLNLTGGAGGGYWFSGSTGIVVVGGPGTGMGNPPAQPSSGNFNGSPGTNPGDGGGGGVTSSGSSQNGGAGAAGLVIVRG